MLTYLRNLWKNSTRFDRVAFALSALIALALNALLSAITPHSDVTQAANTLLTIQMITFEALRVLKNKLGIASRINRQYDSAFGQTGAKIGTVLNIRKPPRFLGRLGDAMQVEDTTETSVPLRLDTLFGVDVEYNETERALSLDNFSQRVLAPMVATVANKVDFDIWQKYKDIYNVVGTPGTTPSSFSTYLDAGVKLQNEAAPTDGRLYMGVNPQMQATIVNAGLGYFNPANMISDQYRNGRMGQFGGFDWFMDQNAPTHTEGTYSGSVTLGATSSSGNSITFAGITTTGLKKGSTFTVADCYAVNPQSRQSTGQLRQFTITQDTGADTAGALTVTVDPEIVISGAFQNVDSAPTSGKTVTFTSSSARVYGMGLAFHPDFCTLATADLLLPKGVHEAARVSDPDLGLSIRMVTAFDIRTNKMLTRLDILYGIAVLYPQLACRVAA